MDAIHTKTNRIASNNWRAGDPRCLHCGYRLVGLVAPACPECGRVFDPKNPKTYTLRRPFVWYRYWWPGALLSVGAGFGWGGTFYSISAMGWGLFIGVPFMLGALIGYRPIPKRRIERWVVRGAVITGAGLLVLLLMAGGFAGLFCGVVLLFVFIPLALAGFYLGVGSAYLLACILKQTRFSQREYLPAFVVLLMLPGMLHLLEAALAPPIQPASIQTVRVVDANTATAWEAQMFYEEVPGPRPVLHRIGLPVPQDTEGSLRLLGDEQVCHFSGGGCIVRRVTHLDPEEMIAFEVVEQKGFEERSVRFIRGRYTFTTVDEHRTCVTLTSDYQPLLRPRALWRPIESAMAGQLHGHILEGMADRAMDIDTQNRLETKGDL